MALFGNRSPFLPALQAAMAGQFPGVITEGMDPRLMAQILGVPVPASGDFAPAAAQAPPPQAQGPATNHGGAGGLPPQPLPPLPPPSEALSTSARQAGGYLPPSATGPSGGLPPLPPSLPPQPMYGDDPVAPKKKKNPVGDFLKAFAGNLGDNLTGNPVYATHVQNKARLKEQREADERKARSPQQVGHAIVAPDGQGSYRELYRAPSVAEEWAIAQGFEPGTPEFAEAVRQYRLGAWNDEAVAAKRDLTDYRYDRQEGLIDRRYDRSDGQLGRRLDVTRRGQNITRENNVRSTGTSRDNSIRSTGQSNTNNQRSTGTSRENSIRSNETRLQTSRRGRQSAAPVRVKSLDEARRLPPGTLFQTPDGRVKVR